MVRGLHAHRAGLDSFGFTEVAAALCVFAGVWPVTQSRAAGADGDGTERKKTSDGNNRFLQRILL